MERKVPFFVDGGVGATRTDGISTNTTVMLPVEPTEINETDLTLCLLLIVILVF